MEPPLVYKAPPALLQVFCENYAPPVKVTSLRYVYIAPPPPEAEFLMNELEPLIARVASTIYLDCTSCSEPCII